MLKQDDTDAILNRLIFDVCLEQTRTPENLEIDGFKKLSPLQDSRISKYPTVKFWASESENILFGYEIFTRSDRFKVQSDSVVTSCIVESGMWAFPFMGNFNDEVIFRKIEDWVDERENDESYLSVEKDHNTISRDIKDFRMIGKFKSKDYPIFDGYRLMYIGLNRGMNLDGFSDNFHFSILDTILYELE